MKTKNIFIKIKQYFCLHHFDLNKIYRKDNLSYLECTKCNKVYSAYYGYTLTKYAKTITPIGEIK